MRPGAARRGVRRPLAAAAVLTSALVLGACGGGSDDSSRPGAGAGGSAPPSSPTSPASGGTPTSTATTPTAEPTAQAGGPTRLDAEQAAAVLDDAIDDTSAAHLVVENGLGFLSGEGDVDFRQTPSSLAMTLTSDETGDDQQVVVLVVDDTLYLQDGASSYLSVDIDSASNPFGRSLSDQLDPRTVLGVVEDNLLAASDRGSVDDAGESLSAYRVRADGPAVATALAPELAAQDDVVVPDVVTCDLTVGDDGRARSITVDLGDDGQIAYTLSDWRTDVGIEAPPSAQTSALPDLGG